MSDADIEQMHSDGSDKGIEKAPPTEQEKIDLQHQEEYKNGGSIDPYIFYKNIPSPEILPRRVKYFKEVEEIIENSIARYKPEQNPEDAQNPLAPNKKDVGKAKQSYIESVLVRKATQQGGAISREQEQIIREQVREIFNEMCDRSYFFKVGTPSGVLENSWIVDYYYIVNKKAFIKGEEVQDILPVNDSETP